MPREYFGCWNRTFDDLSNTETASEQTCDSKGAVTVLRARNQRRRLKSIGERTIHSCVTGQMVEPSGAPVVARKGGTTAAKQ